MFKNSYNHGLLMNRMVAISVFAFVAIIMGFSAVAPMVSQAYAVALPRTACDELYDLAERGLIPKGVYEDLCIDNR